MFPPALRFGVAALALALGVWRTLDHGISGPVYLILAALLVWGYWRSGTVWLAFFKAQRGDLPGAGRLLAATPRTRLLSGQSRAYAAWIEGSLALQREDWETAERSFEAAVVGDLRSPHDRALVHCYLAGLAVRRGDGEGARVQLGHARSLDRSGRLAPTMEKIEEGLAAL